MTKGPGEGNGGDEGAKIIKLFSQPPGKTLPDIKRAKAAGLDKPETLIALMRGHLRLPRKDEPLDDGRSRPDMSASRRIVNPDGELVGIGSLREIEERLLTEIRQKVAGDKNRKIPPSNTGGNDAAQ